MTRILTVIALLFATPAWAGEVDGKSFLCELQSGNQSASIKALYRNFALKFEDRKAKKYFYNDYEETYYSTDDTSVRWAVGSGQWLSYSMSRKTLTLKIENHVDRTVLDIFQCKFMSLKNARNIIDEYGNFYREKAREGNQF